MVQSTNPALWFGGLLVASVSLLVGNKIVAESYTSNNLTILFQQVIATLILYVGIQAGKFGETKPFKKQQFISLLIPALLNSLQLLTSIKSLPYVAIATTVVFRNVSTFACAFIETTFLGATISIKAKGALVVIFVGAVIYAAQDINFNFWGYMYLTLNCVAYTINNVYSKVTITDMDQTGTGVSMIQLLISLPVFTLYAIFFGEIPGGLYKAFELRGTVLYVFLFLGLMGTLISMSYNNLYKLVSATSVVVAANMNKVAAILLAWYVFGKPLSAMQIFGLLVCICGGVSYSVILKQDKAAAKLAAQKYEKVNQTEEEDALEMQIPKKSGTK
jgi:drug/metabolite transporter (DMT)-like permease